MSKWIDLETDASTGKPYLWKCDECGEEVETRWNYCPECGDPKTGKAKSINTLVKALETEHRKLKEMQSKLSTNLAEVGTRAVRGYQIDADALMEKVAEEYGERARDRLYQIIRYMAPAQPEKLTDIEQRIFLAAMSKEEKVCRQVDKESSDADCINLMRVCKSIERKVKGALWT